jgi:hypothetical protein
LQDQPGCNAEMLLRQDYAAVVEPNDYERERFKVLEKLSCARCRQALLSKFRGQ